MRKPLVEIVVPVYNGERYLRECIESILGQTYDRWNAVIINNCSSDQSGAIAEHFAKRDQRLRVINCREFLGQSEHYNRCLEQVSPLAEYIKIVEADNQITEDALTQMIRVAERFPEVGIVGCYSIAGRGILGAGVKFDTDILSGVEVWRLLLLEEKYLLGTPTSLLFRAKALLNEKPCFNPALFYDDADLCVRILRKWKLGYVPQILAFIRDDNDGIGSKYRNYNFEEAVLYFLSIDYAVDFMGVASAEQLVRQCEKKYLRKLARAAISRRGKKYWEFHRRAWQFRGEKLRMSRLLAPIIAEFLDLVLNPKSTTEHLLMKLNKMSSRS